MTAFKKTAGGAGRTAHYADLDRQTREDLVRSLLDEQGYICCYCMGRIAADGRSMLRIEHWRSQSRYPDEQLNYGNLLASCHGDEAEPQAHCDVRKGDADLSCNPADPGVDIEAKLRYLADGTIVTDDERLNHDLDVVLNLNGLQLKSNRVKTMRAVDAQLNKRPGSRTPEQIEKLIARWESRNDRNHFQPYMGVALYRLKKRWKHSK